MGKECKNVSFKGAESWGFDYRSIKSGPEQMFLLLFCWWRTKEAYPWASYRNRPGSVSLSVQQVRSWDHRQWNPLPAPKSQSCHSILIPKCWQEQSAPYAFRLTHACRLCLLEAGVSLQLLSVTCTDISNLLSQGVAVCPRRWCGLCFLLCFNTLAKPVTVALRCQPLKKTGCLSCRDPFAQQWLCPLGWKIRFLCVWPINNSRRQRGTLCLTQRKRKMGNITSNMVYAIHNIQYLLRKRN